MARLIFIGILDGLSEQRQPHFCFFGGAVLSKAYNVNINMLSVINGDNDGDMERNESDHAGSLVCDGEGKMTLAYSEKTEGGPMSTEIHLRDGRVVVKRRGAIVSDMVFSEGKKNTSVYSIPPHSFDMTVECRRLKVKIMEDNGRIDMLYKMEIGGEARSARMRIIWNLI